MESRGQAVDETKPRDIFHITYIIHFFLGAGNLVPWNAFITAIDYFLYLYPKKHVAMMFSVAYMTSALLVLVILLFLSYWKKLPDFRIRMNLAQALFILVLITPLVTEKFSNQNEKIGSETTYMVLVFTLVVCGIADGLCVGSLVGATGELPGRYTQAVFAGTSSAGILVCIMRIVTKASVPHSPKGLRISTRIYFIISSSIIVICLICYNVLHKLPVVKYYRQQTARTRTTPSYNFQGDKENPKLWDVVKTIRHAVIGMLVLYIVTLSTFPGYVTENVKSKFFSDWYPVLLLATYNVGDVLGIALTALFVPKSIFKTMWFCMARLTFYPLFAACVNGPQWLRSEAPVIFLTGALGFTNGYLTSVLMILAPKSVTAHVSERVGISMALSLMTGLTVGSFVAWLWVI